MRISLRRAAILTALIALAAPAAAPAHDNDDRSLRVATFNASLNRNVDGQLIADLSTPANAQAAAVAEVIQRVRPEVLLINEFDFDAQGTAARLFQDNYLSVPRNGAKPIRYGYRYSAESNTGIPSGLDLNNNGTVGGPDDAFGFGFFPGQFGMQVYSRHPIAKHAVRTFQHFRWKDMPGARLPDDPATPAPADFYSPEELAMFRLSSKSHWDIPLIVHGKPLHFLVSHPTPPVFDGPEDRNGRRNADEIRFWADYLRPGARSAYIYDDEGGRGGLHAGARFVIAGDQNSDPLDGDSVPGAIQQLLEHKRIDASFAPRSAGAVEASALQGGANTTHRSDPAFDTADFADGAPGNLRADYVLPSKHGLKVRGGFVFWPQMSDPLSRLTGTFPFPTSDHRLVALDLKVKSAHDRSDGPLVIGHRGAAGYLPDHTLPGYALAAKLGADYIEPDLVATKDGRLIARHEPNIASTTDVASHPEFADRKRTMVVDGATETGWFASDFTLKEIKTLRAVQPLAERPQQFNGKFRIPTLQQVIALAKKLSKRYGRTIGIYPETKHPTYHQQLGLALEPRLVRALKRAGWNKRRSPVFIQSFEQANLKQLHRMTRVKLVQLIDANDVNADGSLDFTAPFDRPYDWTVSGEPELLSRTFAFFTTNKGLKEVRRYADGIGPWKPYINSTTAVDINGDGVVGDENGDGQVNETDRKLTAPSTLVKRAHARGLLVHPYTFRSEQRRLAFDYGGNPINEYLHFYGLGVDGVFTDFTDDAVVARELFALQQDGAADEE